MYFHPKQLLLGAFCLFAGVARASDCDEGPWEGVYLIGSGNTGGPFCHTKYKEGIVMTGVEVWADDNRVQAIQFYYSDGTNSGQMGKIKGDKHDRMDWDPSTDGISQAKSWGNGRAQALGRVYLRLKSGKELDVGRDTSGQDSFEHNVFSGIMLGAVGRSGDNIDQLGWLFLKSKIDAITVSDVEFKDTVEALNSKKEYASSISSEVSLLIVSQGP